MRVRDQLTRAFRESQRPSAEVADDHAVGAHDEREIGQRADEGIR
jgi:hypothetical protein